MNVDQWTLLDTMRKQWLKMNLAKFFLGVSSSELLGLIVTSKRINLDPNKVNTNQEIHPPRNLKELIWLQGRLAYIQLFIANLLG